MTKQGELCIMQVLWINEKRTEEVVIVLKKIHLNANCLLLRGILLVVQQNQEEIEHIKQYFL